MYEKQFHKHDLAAIPLWVYLVMDEQQTLCQIDGILCQSSQQKLATHFQCLLSSHTLLDLTRRAVSLDSMSSIEDTPPPLENQCGTDFTPQPTKRTRDDRADDDAWEPPKFVRKLTAEMVIGSRVRQFTVQVETLDDVELVSIVRANYLWLWRCAGGSEDEEHKWGSWKHLMACPIFSEITNATQLLRCTSSSRSRVSWVVDAEGLPIPIVAEITVRDHTLRVGTMLHKSRIRIEASDANLAWLTQQVRIDLQKPDGQRNVILDTDNKPGDVMEMLGAARCAEFLAQGISFHRSRRAFCASHGKKRASFSVRSKAPDALSEIEHQLERAVSFAHGGAKPEQRSLRYREAPDDQSSDAASDGGA